MFGKIEKILKKYLNNKNCLILDKNLYCPGRGLWGAFDRIECIFDDNRKPTINIILPGISKHMSAGPLSIIMFGLFLIKNSYNVRLLVLNGTRRGEDIADVMRYQSKEISEYVDYFEYSPLKDKILCNKNDIFVGTLFNTAHIASQLAKQCVNKKIIYFIQDDETMFFSASSLKVVADESYYLDCYPIFSTEILKKTFL